MRFVCALGLVFVVGVSVSLAESLKPRVIPPAGYSSCSVSDWSPPNFSGTCIRTVARAMPAKNNSFSVVAGGNIEKYIASMIAQGGDCKMAGHKESLCLEMESLGCKWFSPQGGTRNGKPISQRDIDNESFCYDNCARQPLERCSETTGCVIGQEQKIRIVNSYHRQPNDGMPSNEGRFPMVQKCVRASTVRG